MKTRLGYDKAPFMLSQREAIGLVRVLASKPGAREQCRFPDLMERLMEFTLGDPPQTCTAAIVSDPDTRCIGRCAEIG